MFLITILLGYQIYCTDIRVLLFDLILCILHVSLLGLLCLLCFGLFVGFSFDILLLLCVKYLLS